MRLLKAERYRDPKRDGSNRLADFVARRLHALDYAEAIRFYKAVVPTLTWRDQAFLACNDRYFLLVGMLGRTDMAHPWVYDRAREVESDPDGYLDLWAREHYKSTVITFGGIIQEVLINPEITISIFSHTQKGASKFLVQIKDETERNQRLKRSFDDVIWDNPKRQAPMWSAGGLKFKRQSNPKEATIEAHGLIDGMPTGGHYNLLVYDDVITEKTVANPEMVKKATEQWEMSDNLGAGNVRKWHIGTRYSFSDSYGIMMERGVKPRIYPATDNGKIDGSPVLFSREKWASKVKVQRSTLAAQMLQNPLAGKENTFNPVWISSWEVRPSQLNIYIMGDPSGGRTKGSDRTAFAVVGIDGGGVKYFLDGYRHRMSLSERWVALRDLYKKWSNQPGIQMVNVGYEKYGMQEDDAYFRERMTQEGVSFAIRELNWVRDGSQSKKSRVERLEPDVRLARLLLPITVFEPGVQVGNAIATWRYDDELNKFAKKPMAHPTSNMRRLIAAGAIDRCARPIMRKDEDGRLYDVTLALIEEMSFFPFAPKDDLIDAVSRIYDMDPVTPNFIEDSQANDIRSRDFADA